MPTYGRRGPCLAGIAFAGIALAAGLTGCSGASSPSAPVTPSAGVSAATVTATPAATRVSAGTVGASGVRTGEATCGALSATQVGALLGAPVRTGVIDRRADQAGQRQLDGCSFSGDNGIHLGYLVWTLSAGGTGSTVRQGLPPTQAGVQSFAPGVGVLSAGTVISTGPVSVAQVNAIVTPRLIQVSVTATSTSVARSAAVAAARALALAG